jgi:hypothetical protein
MRINSIHTIRRNINVELYFETERAKSGGRKCINKIHSVQGVHISRNALVRRNVDLEKLSDKLAI